MSEGISYRILAVHGTKVPPVLLVTGGVFDMMLPLPLPVRAIAQYASTPNSNVTALAASGRKSAVILATAFVTSYLDLPPPPSSVHLRRLQDGTSDTAFAFGHIGEILGPAALYSKRAMEPVKLIRRSDIVHRLLIWKFDTPSSNIVTSSSPAPLYSQMAARTDVIPFRNVARRISRAVLWENKWHEKIRGPAARPLSARGNSNPAFGPQNHGYLFFCCFWGRILEKAHKVKAMIASLKQFF
ncbi:hypothetical protein FB451DRAFT_1468381 [Mycena latifolia]|nr:hypothetical protein FB451DRAFT_1468381 [Mycena latifolia]